MFGLPMSFKKQMEHRTTYNLLLDDMAEVIGRKDRKDEYPDEDITSDGCAESIMWTLNPSELQMMKRYRSFSFKYGIKRELWQKVKKEIFDLRKYCSQNDLHDAFCEACKNEIID